MKGIGLREISLLKNPKTYSFRYYYSIANRARAEKVRVRVGYGQKRFEYGSGKGRRDMSTGSRGTSTGKDFIHGSDASTKSRTRVVLENKDNRLIQSKSWK